MKCKTFSLLLAGLMLALFTGAAWAGPDVAPGGALPDKALCAKMIRFGREAYERGKYLDAKEYFRKAVKADPSSDQAWLFYDQTVVFALAEKVEKNAGLLTPGTSTRHEAAFPSESAPPPPAPAAAQPEKASPESAPKKDKGDTGFKILEDEGC